MKVKYHECIVSYKNIESYRDESRNSRFQRVIIWGHRPRFVKTRGIYQVKRHTHSYIHEGYFRAFAAMGFSTIWLDNFPSAKLDDFKSALVITEDQADESLPASPDASYVLHHSSKRKYHDVGAEVLNLANFTVADTRKTPDGTTVPRSLEELDEVTFYDSASRTLYQPWATDLLPSEISLDMAISPKRSTEHVHYVGTIGHDGIRSMMRNIRYQSWKLQLRLKVHTNVDGTTAQALLCHSATAFDIRGNHHRNVGYIPCRIWKGLSYGLPMTSNSPLLESVFGDRINFKTFEGDFLESAVEHTLQSKRGQIVDNLSWIRSRHTFVNRARRILEVLQ